MRWKNFSQRLALDTIDWCKFGLKFIYHTALAYVLGMPLMEFGRFLGSKYFMLNGEALGANIAFAGVAIYWTLAIVTWIPMRPRTAQTHEELFEESVEQAAKQSKKKKKK